MKITASTRETFIPEISENLQLPEEERIAITYDKPKATQRAHWRRVVAGENPKGGIETWSEIDTRKIILESNVKIENLIAEVDGEEKEISTGRELVDLRSDFASGLAEMLAYRILRQDWKDELKN